ncbi:MAG: molybdopterin-binding protein [Alphaproteobacteria bacterium]|nr:molybdopterin-binding protein [Alphaproteobacteria bacterium]
MSDNASTENPSAAILIIGNEILSGRTKDLNLPWLGEQLSSMGIRLSEARVVRDDEAAIIEALNILKSRNKYVFTTGGIGPTHDDITSACIAKAFNIELHRHPDALAALLAHYKPEDVNEARLKMADVPQGAVLVANPVSAAPGYRIENVYVFAGVPRIMQAMFDNIRHELVGGAPIKSRTITVFLTEGAVADKLTQVQNANSCVEIGSYPMIKDSRLGTSLVLRSSDEAALEVAYAQVEAMIRDLDGEVTA